MVMKQLWLQDHLPIKIEDLLKLIVLFPALATREVTIPAGTRICQFRIQKEQPKIVFKKVDTLGNENRSGLGSSGL